MAIIFAPKLLHIGAGVSAGLASVLLEAGLRRPLIVADEFTSKFQGFHSLVKPLEQSGIPFGLFDGCVPNPTDTSIIAGARLLAQGAFDCLVAIGGGSVIDTAKGIALVAAAGDQIFNSDNIPRDILLRIPIIAIPTTAGSGSEVTPFAVVTHMASRRKFSVGNYGFIPYASLVDFELTMGMPKALTADCGMDCLSHAIESLSSKRSHPFAESLARNALFLVGKFLVAAFNDPTDRAAREAMMLASTQSAMASASTGVGLVHELSRPLSAYFHVPHGRANALLMPKVVNLLSAANRARYRDIAHCVRAAGSDPDQEDAAEWVVGWLERLNKELEIHGFEEQGINRESYFEAIPAMASRAYETAEAAGTDAFLPSVEQIAQIYRDIY